MDINIARLIATDTVIAAKARVEALGKRAKNSQILDMESECNMLAALDMSKVATVEHYLNVAANASQIGR